MSTTRSQHDGPVSEPNGRREAGGGFCQGPVEAHADVAAGWRESDRAPGEPVALEVQTVEQVPGDDGGVVELSAYRGAAGRRLQEDLGRLVVLHRDRLEGPPKVAVDASVATVHVVDRSARWENGVVSPGTPGQRTAKVSSSALMTAA
jgi:hypothetical protein